MSLTFSSELLFHFLSNAFQPTRFVIDYSVFSSGGGSLGNPLRTLLDLPEPEKAERGLEHTPREIWQQPATWGKTYAALRGARQPT